MDTRTVLSKIVTLIYRSRMLDSTDYDSLIKTVLDTIKVDSPEFNFLGKNVLKNFKDTCVTLLEEKDSLPKEILIPQLSILLENDQKLLSVIKDAIEPDHDETINKRIVTNLVKALNNYYREQMAIDVISKVSYDLKFNRNKIGNFSEYLQNTISQLEPLATAVTSIKDPAVVSEVDFENPDSVTTIFDEVKNINSNTGVYKTGWQAFNRMCQGGFRTSGEFILLAALQHKYKSGCTLSLFSQIATHNKPIVNERNAGKKPLLLRISLEDNLSSNLQFLYQYNKAKNNEPVSAKDFETLTSKEMSDYVLKVLTATGFHIKMIRVDPSQWSYTHLFNKIIELEAQGYAIHVCMVDYLGMLPTTGCTQGPAGTDKRDLIRRVRNFTSARGIIFITPWQLSSEAKQLIRNGVPEHQLVNEIAERGYFADSKQIDQELDLEIYIHLFTHKRKKYLAVRRGKHRVPTVISDEDKYFMLPFGGLNIPILPDVDGDDSSLTKLPKGDYEDGSSNAIEDLLG